MGLDLPLQCLLQTLFSQNALTENNLRAVIAELVYGGNREEVTREVINETIATINEDLSDLDFEIRRTIEQIECKNIWVLCNTTSDELTQMATHHSAKDIAFFKILLELIFVKNNTRRAEVFAVSKMDAVQHSTGAGLTKAQGEAVLQQFVDESWLQQSSKGFYSPTARTLMELQGYLQETYNDEDEDEEGESNNGGSAAKVIKSCHACREFLTVVRAFYIPAMCMWEEIES